MIKSKSPAWLLLFSRLELEMNKFFRKSLFLIGISLLAHTLNASTNPGTATHASSTTVGSSQITEEYQYIIAASGQDITTSGVYLFSESIEYTTDSTGPAAICISVDNVTIDLNGQMLLCEDGVGATVHGICIDPGVKNVTIKDGTIVGFPGNAIDMEGTAALPIFNVKMENMRMVTNEGGVFGEYVRNAVIEEVNIHDTQKTDNVYGFYFSNSDSVYINKCISNRAKTVTTSKQAYGVYFNHCIASTVEDTMCSNNQGQNGVTGIYFTDAITSGIDTSITVGEDNYQTFIESNYIINCTCNNNISLLGDAHGIHLDQADLVYVDGCTMRNNRAGLQNSTPIKQSYGLRLQNAQNITAVGNLATRNNFGFWDDQPLFEQSNLFIRNTAYWNVSKLPGGPTDGSEGTTKGDFIRTVSTPIDFIEASVDHLQDMFAASSDSNRSVVIKLDTNA